MNPKISIIVPVYNNKMYIEKCIESIQAQTYKNTEILLIDDGSEKEYSVFYDKVITNVKRGG